MILLDTNVISAIAAEDDAVVTWLAGLADPEFWMAATTVMEIEAGLQRLPVGRRRDDLERRLDAVMTAWQGRILALDAHVARVAGAAVAARMNTGRAISIADAQIAASALVLGATLATRNTRDFMGLGLALVDPWAA